MRTIKISSALDEAATIKTLWEANPNLKMDSIGLDEFLGVYAATEELEKDCAKRDTELAGVRGKRDDKARQLTNLITRFRSGVRFFYGQDSPEYAQAGGTRVSARRSRARKPGAVETSQA